MNSKNNKTFALRLLAWFCPAQLYEEIEGDLIQRFHKDTLRFGEPKARRRLLWNVIRFFRPGILLRNRISLSLMPLYMLTNYLKIAFRIMLRNKSYSMINIFGLALGLTGALLLGLWIQKEFSYDQFHTDKEQLYLVWNKQTSNQGVSCWSATPRVLAPTLSSGFTAIESAVSFAHYNDTYLFAAGDKRILKNSAYFTDPEFLEMFSFPLVRGDVKTAMANSNSIVLTESFAKQLFGDKEAFGETISLSEAGYTIPFTVTGILKDIPTHSDFKFDYLIPWQFIESNYGKDTSWGNNSVSTWVKIRKESSLADLNEAIKDLKQKNTRPDDAELFLYPLLKMHLYSRFENGVPAGGRIEIIRMMGILGICLVVIACINFINLSTARASRRAKEVAVRKVTGAFRQSLVTQFLCESVLVTIGATIIALVAAYLMLPFFGSLVQQRLTLNFGDLSFWMGIGACILIIGLLAGGYPALYLSSFLPSRILKGSATAASGKSRLRSFLVIFQFGFGLTMITSTIVIYKQVTFLQNRETGYDKNQLVYQYQTGDLIKNFSAYKNDLLESGTAISITRTGSPITERLSNSSSMQWNGKDPENKTVIERFFIDENMATTMGVDIIKGRDLDLKKYPADSTAILLNEAAAKLMGFKDPIGEVVRDNGIDWHVVGVVHDFILTSPYRQVEPIVMVGSKANRFGVIHIRLNPEKKIQECIEGLDRISKKYNPDYPFEYHFVDQEYAYKFSNVETTLTITTLFCGIAIFIGSLGLLGLSTYMIEARVKEIGIRKVMGGSVASIIGLLSGSALRPIGWAILIFSPGAWWGMNWWLQSFEYRISFSIWILALAAALIVSIAFLTIGFQVYQAARVNPVKSLKSE